MKQINKHNKKRTTPNKKATIVNPTIAKTEKIGLYKGKLTITEDFDAPLPDKIIDSFYKKLNFT